METGEGEGREEERRERCQGRDTVPKDMLSRTHSHLDPTS
jgi:hypothetical protein